MTCWKSHPSTVSVVALKWLGSSVHTQGWCQHDTGDGRGATHLPVSYGDTPLNARKAGFCWGAGAHRVLLSLSLRQLSSIEGAEARNIIIKTTLRSRGNFWGLACSARLESFVGFFTACTRFFVFLFFILFFIFFFHFPPFTSSFYSGKCKGSFQNQKKCRIGCQRKKCNITPSPYLVISQFVQIKTQNNRLLLLELIIRFAMKEGHKWHHFYQK